jgi:hypothetical protein
LLLESILGAKRYDSMTLWVKRFAWLPHRCCKSGKWIWLTTAYCGMIVISTPNENIVDKRWMHKHEYLLKILKDS